MSNLPPGLPSSNQHTIVIAGHVSGDDYDAFGIPPKPEECLLPARWQNLI